MTEFDCAECGRHIVINDHESNYRLLIHEEEQEFEDCPGAKFVVTVSKDFICLDCS